MLTGWSVGGPRSCRLCREEHEPARDSSKHQHRRHQYQSSEPLPVLRSILTPHPPRPSVVNTLVLYDSRVVFSTVFYAKRTAVIAGRTFFLGLSSVESTAARPPSVKIKSGGPGGLIFSPCRMLKVHHWSWLNTFRSFHSEITVTRSVGLPRLFICSSSSFSCVCVSVTCVCCGTVSPVSFHGIELYFLQISRCDAATDGSFLYVFVKSVLFRRVGP